MHIIQFNLYQNYCLFIFIKNIVLLLNSKLEKINNKYLYNNKRAIFISNNSDPYIELQ